MPNLSLIVMCEGRCWGREADGESGPLCPVLDKTACEGLRAVRVLKGQASSWEAKMMPSIEQPEVHSLSHCQLGGDWD